MWCPRCRADLPAGLLTCPVCGEAPIELAPPDPGRGIPRSQEFAAEVAVYPAAVEGRAALDLLSAAGVAAELVVRPGGDDFTVAVRPPDVGRAAALLGTAGGGSCPLCAAPVAAGDTVCMRCGEPLG